MKNGDKNKGPVPVLNLITPRYTYPPSEEYDVPVEYPHPEGSIQPFPTDLIGSMGYIYLHLVVVNVDKYTYHTLILWEWNHPTMNEMAKL